MDSQPEHEPQTGRSHHSRWRQPVQQAVGVGNPGEERAPKARPISSSTPL